MKIIICDLDGTLCDHSHRKHLAAGKDFDGYHGKLNLDGPNHAVREIIHRMVNHHPVILITGRPEKYRQQTELWLLRYHIEYDDLYMRPDDDMRPDVELKQAIFIDHIINTDDVLFVLEDRDCVVDMWRKIGLTCLQVEKFEVGAEGNDHN